MGTPAGPVPGCPLRSVVTSYFETLWVSHARYTRTSYLTVLKLRFTAR
ncbi:MAG: hypothetical protein PWR16_2234, partial [Methanoculleus sp.]|nr:hypothetical protein [Methanoculleus sp.]